MGVIDLFTKRALRPEPVPAIELRLVDRFFGPPPATRSLNQSQLQSGLPTLPLPFRVQAVQLLEDAIGGFRDYNEKQKPTREISQWVVERLCREYGVFCLSTDLESLERHYLHELTQFIIQERQTLRALDAIELVFRARWDPSLGWASAVKSPARLTRDEAQDELNTRFREHGLAYQMVQCHIVDTGGANPSQGLDRCVDNDRAGALSVVRGPVAALVASLTDALNGLQAPGHEEAYRDLSQALRAQRSGQHQEALSFAAVALAESIRVTGHKLGISAGDALSTAEALQRAGYVDRVWVRQCSLWLTPTDDSGTTGSGATDCPRLVTFGLHSITASLVYLLDTQRGAG